MLRQMPSNEEMDKIIQEVRKLPARDAFINIGELTVNSSTLDIIRYFFYACKVARDKSIKASKVFAKYHYDDKIEKVADFKIRFVDFSGKIITPSKKDNIETLKAANLLIETNKKRVLTYPRLFYNEKLIADCRQLNDMHNKNKIWFSLENRKDVTNLFAPQTYDFGFNSLNKRKFDDKNENENDIFIKIPKIEVYNLPSYTLSTVNSNANEEPTTPSLDVQKKSPSEDIYWEDLFEELDPPITFNSPAISNSQVPYELPENINPQITAQNEQEFSNEGTINFYRTKPGFTYFNKKRESNPTKVVEETTQHLNNPQAVGSFEMKKN